MDNLHKVTNDEIEKGLQPTAIETPIEHDFSTALGACKGCGLYVEECLEHRYCTPKRD